MEAAEEAACGSDRDMERIEGDIATSVMGKLTRQKSVWHYIALSVTSDWNRDILSELTELGRQLQAEISGRWNDETIALVAEKAALLYQTCRGVMREMTSAESEGETLDPAALATSAMAELHHEDELAAELAAVVPAAETRWISRGDLTPAGGEKRVYASVLTERAFRVLQERLEADLSASRSRGQALADAFQRILREKCERINSELERALEDICADSAHADKLGAEAATRLGWLDYIRNKAAAITEI
jgi:hypothetical protein